MAVQIVRNQLIDLVINADKLDTGAVSYGKIASADIETSLTGGANKLASASAIKAYVDAQVPDTFSGGDGINIDETGNPDVIEVDLATNPGLQFTSGKLDLKIAENSLIKDSAGVKVKLKAESGGTISVDTNGIYLANGAVANAKLANSTISGKALGSNLDSLSAGDGISMTAFNGSAAVSDLTVQLDGTTLAKGAAGLKVNTGGISTAQLQDNAVTTAKIGTLQVTEGRLANLSVSEGKIQDSAVTADKVAFGTQLEAFTTDGSATSFDLSATINQAFAIVMVHRNGLMLQQVGPSDTPSGVDEFKLDLTGGAAGVSKVIFGAAPAASDSVTIFYIA